MAPSAVPVLHTVPTVEQLMTIFPRYVRLVKMDTSSLMNLTSVCRNVEQGTKNTEKDAKVTQKCCLVLISPKTMTSRLRCGNTKYRKA